MIMTPKKNNSLDVTIAEMSKDIKYLVEQVDEQNNKYDSFCEQAEKRTRDLETKTALNTQNLETIGIDVDYLKKESRAWNIINTFFAAAAAALGIGITKG